MSEGPAETKREEGFQAHPAPEDAAAESGSEKDNVPESGKLGPLGNSGYSKHPQCGEQKRPQSACPPPQILSTPGWQIDEEELGLEKGLQPSGARSGQRAQH